MRVFALQRFVVGQADRSMAMCFHGLLATGFELDGRARSPSWSTRHLQTEGAGWCHYRSRLLLVAAMMMHSMPTGSCGTAIAVLIGSSDNAAFGWHGAVVCR